MAHMSEKDGAYAGMVACSCVCARETEKRERIGEKKYI